MTKIKAIGTFYIFNTKEKLYIETYHCNEDKTKIHPKYLP